MMNSKAKSTPPYKQIHLTWKRIYSEWINWTKPHRPPPPKPTHFSIASHVQDDNLDELVSEIVKLDPALQRNLGVITGVQNLRLLAQAIELGELQAIIDASIGSRIRAAHSYILITKDKRCLLKGSAPVDSDPDDIESTRAELCGNIAIHTILNVLTYLFEITTGEVDVGCDNKDALCRQSIKIDEISFPRFF